ncbi:5-oxoprolinase subunit B family protein [Paractinoplanes brasiliensis]|uniref:KipI family sensor histidine kinase inhibitor n=1 Tax=Paractinoplanes brasiliensis TaxID=52695 RepID=A0A4R6JXG0_9ACTN|nr:allophanate hydrolase subunit 1 [Actinoplanes brasiliensis]TDO39395.1 KipI family sensor histidine kinase inhibitor [Actinoplanes brasiliensis]GID32685.1 allophanate hydrolase [Actinoplanes brasiliensis]
MRLRRAGASALLIECRDGAEVEAWRREACRRRDTGELRVIDIVPGARTLLLDGVEPGAEAVVSAWSFSGGAASAHRPAPLVEIQAVFDGGDLEDVASLLGMSPSGVIARLAGTEFTVAFCGFAPGFAYMRGHGLTVPRLDAPRPRVPAGSIGLAGEYCGIYPTASPGGWRLVGRTSETLFDVRRDPPARLTPGTRVRLVAA